MEIDRNAFLASRGGVSQVNLLSPEAKADALEDLQLFKSLLPDRFEIL